MDSGLVVPFGRYVLKERLAQGGMGEVFRAVAVGEHGFEKPVVVKRVLPAHAGREDLTDLFVAEAKLMTRLAHPNIVEVLDFGRGEHRDYYLVLELVEGADLGRLARAVSARGESFPVPLALFIASQVLRGLHHAHTKSAGEGAVVVHRDVSPSNVLCSTEGEVKVADFGVALVTRGGEGGGQAGVAGKPGYMAPEQFDGGSVDPRADLFSAAVVLQQMLTGEMPFAGETLEAQQDAARRGQRRSALDRRPEIGEAIEAILARAMAPRPEDRFPDARAMAQAIEALRDGGQRIATGDDLADAVRAAQRELPAAGRKVIALTGSSAAAPASEDAPRELTRTGAPGGVGAFTLRFPVRADATTRPREGEGEGGTRPADRWSTPEPRTERIAPDERLHASAAGVVLDGPEGSPTAAGAPESASGTGGAASIRRASGGVPEPVERTAPPVPDETPAGEPRRRGIRWVGITAVLAAALIGLVAFVVRTPQTAVAPGPPPAATTPAAMTPAAIVLPQEPSTPAPSTPPPPAATVEPAPKGSARVVPARSGAPATAGTPAAPVTAVASATASASAAPAEDCAGDVDFFSDTSWTISGGPSAVASPTRGVVWKCGTYTLTATSRVDPSQQQTRVITVGPKRHTVVDLR